MEGCHPRSHKRAFSSIHNESSQSETAKDAQYTFKALLIGIIAVCMIGCIYSKNDIIGIVNDKRMNAVGAQRRILSESSPSYLPPFITALVMRLKDCKQTPTELLRVVHDFANDPHYFMSKPQRDIMNTLTNLIEKDLITERHRQILIGDDPIFPSKYVNFYKVNAEGQKKYIGKRKRISRVEMDCVNQIIMKEFRPSALRVKYGIPDPRVDLSHYHIYSLTPPMGLIDNYLDTKRDYCESQKQTK